jgi:hypothetical protein
MAKCRSCASDQVSVALDIGELPVSNGYDRPGEESPRNSLMLGACPACGLLQLINPFSAALLSQVVPKWVAYKEPEEHLDLVCAKIREIVGDITGVLSGLSAIDTSLVARLRHCGWGAGREKDETLANQRHLETVVANVESGSAELPARGSVLIVARHVLDHVRELGVFFDLLRSRLGDGGWVLFEVPSSIRFLEKRDPLMLWESHANYFTSDSLQQTLLRHGFTTEWCELLRANDSDVLVALARKTTPYSPVAAGSKAPPWDLINFFVDEYAPRSKAYQRRFGQVKNSGQRIGLLGAGHMANLFLNLYHLAGYFDFAFDDDPFKAGLRMPGSNLPILPTSAIADRNIGTLILGVNRNAEERVAARFAHDYPSLQLGSIFPDSPFSLL